MISLMLSCSLEIHKEVLPQERFTDTVPSTIIALLQDGNFALTRRRLKITGATTPDEMAGVIRTASPCNIFVSGGDVLFTNWKEVLGELFDGQVKGIGKFHVFEARKVSPGVIFFKEFHDSPQWQSKRLLKEGVTVEHVKEVWATNPHKRNLATAKPLTERPGSKKLNRAAYLHTSIVKANHAHEEEEFVKRFFGSGSTLREPDGVAPATTAPPPSAATTAGREQSGAPAAEGVAPQSSTASTVSHSTTSMAVEVENPSVTAPRLTVPGAAAHQAPVVPVHGLPPLPPSLRDLGTVSDLGPAPMECSTPESPDACAQEEENASSAPTPTTQPRATQDSVVPMDEGGVHDSEHRESDNMVEGSCSEDECM
jgi:hypothetical protein